MGQGAEFAGLIPKANLWKKSQIGVLLGMVLSNHTDDHGFMIQLLKRRSEGGLCPAKKKTHHKQNFHFFPIVRLLKKSDTALLSYTWTLDMRNGTNWGYPKCPIYSHNVERPRELLPSSPPGCWRTWHSWVVFFVRDPPNRPKIVISSWWWRLRILGFSIPKHTFVYLWLE